MAKIKIVMEICEEQNEAFVLVKDGSPVWSCKHGFWNKDKNCTYALCNKCYLNNESIATVGNRTGRKKRRGQDQDIHKNQCDHINLQAFDDVKCFSEDYIKQRLDKNDIFPTKCNICMREFRNTLK